ncbi:MAG: hypothetical protein KKB79_00695 [Nanoarchaeota archaeon]|nr:hypothetical protein [Nanoarchaeota archaeon]
MKPTLGMLEEIAERYHNKIRSIQDEESPIAMSHFNHRIGGVGTVILNPEWASERWDTFRSCYKKSLREIKSYLILLDDNKDFREAELYTHNGFLNELYIPLDDYVRASRAKLKVKEVSLKNELQ